MKVEDIRTEEEFDALREEWNGLLVRSTSNNVFLTFDWMRTWWKHYKPDKRLFIVVVRDPSGRLLGIAPLCIKKETLYGLASLRVLTFLGTEEVCSDYLDFILDRGGKEEAFMVILDYIESHSGLWDYVLLSDIWESSWSFNRIKESLATRARDYYLPEVKECPYIALPDSFDAYIKRLSRNSRNNLMRKTRKLQKKYEAVFSECNVPDVETAMEDLFELHKKRREMLRKESDFITKRMMAFHMDISRTLHRKGIVRVYCMRINGVPASMLYGFTYNKKFFYYQAGMDPQYEKLSVGMVLMGYCIKDCIEKGLVEFDFLRGREAYKYRWTDTWKTTASIALPAGGLKGRSYLAAQTILRRAKSITKKGLSLPRDA